MISWSVKLHDWGFGMFPLILAVLNREYSWGVHGLIFRTDRVRGSIPNCVT